ncbi:ABC transporter ATP-binding protein [Cytobacillus sp. IB215665]|uniref:ABC transporter ATP-binding protein n=1 Tax=Cytobacillus sp. IB215665 TaxID=3097357 RepID=UPI002A13863E|nr:ABC transporter ATP-binding protein [Cytobacillus sp. IB215665]MDX8366349.1 ABC transporter ATP-binding protein [Cytobacillus sp. IB215665]
MINVQNVTYGYHQTPVLNHFSFKEDAPIICGIWGKNGAGKTTLMSLLAGHDRPDNGEITIMDQNPYNNLSAQQHICYIQENHPFGKNWTVQDVLKYGQYFHPNWDQELAESLCDLFELPVKKKITKFSKGMKTAAQILLGLASNATVTILDEPTNGLDAVKRKQFYDVLLESYEDNPRLILLSTHHIEEIQPLCESLVVVHEGKVLFYHQMEEMRERGIFLSGAEEDIHKVMKHAKIIESSKIGSTTKIMIDAPYSNEWKKIASEQNLLIEKATLQGYLINMTTTKKVVNV